jgi:hypothetical protein
VFADRVTQFGERGSFQLPNALTRYANYLSHLLKRLCRRAVQSEPMGDDRCLVLLPHCFRNP